MRLRFFERLKLLALFPLGILDFCELESAEAWERYIETQHVNAEAQQR